MKKYKIKNIGNALMIGSFLTVVTTFIFISCGERSAETKLKMNEKELEIKNLREQEELKQESDEKYLKDAEIRAEKMQKKETEKENTARKSANQKSENSKQENNYEPIRENQGKIHRCGRTWYGSKYRNGEWGDYCCEVCYVDFFPN